MTVLLLHNRYRHSGGEDSAVDAEARMLERIGVRVVRHEVRNPPETAGVLERVGTAATAAWSRASYRQVLRLCGSVRPDIAHVHNFWMTLTPSVHAACHAAGVATVQTLHNFRLLCLNALLLRNDRICEDCVGCFPWRGVLRRCYRGSALASIAAASMVAVNRRCETWTRRVDALITPSEHARSRFIAAGLLANRIFVKPNPIEDFGPAAETPSRCADVIYAGRLSREKGVSVLLDAWRTLAQPGRLLIAGDGEDAERLRRISPPGVVFTGPLSSGQTRALIASARLLVQPSLCYETFGMSVVEAFSAGRPVVASDTGTLGEIVRHRQTGLKVPPGDAAALAAALAVLLHEPHTVDRLGRSAREEYLSRYSPEINAQRLLDIYQNVAAAAFASEKVLAHA